MLNENENKKQENNIENKNFKPKIIRNNIENDEEKNISSNLSSGLTKVSNSIEHNYQEEDSSLTPRIIKNFENHEENTTNIIENKTVQNFVIDKDQLYETFLLFQNFMHSNQNNTSRTYSTKQNKTESSLTVNNEFDSNRTNNKIREIDNSISKKISEINIEKNEKNNNLINKNESENKIVNNFDDIPIKSSNTNFEELLEKNLANGKYEEPKNIIKKKIIKPHKEIKKKIISISKPSKNDKKYSYYTDLLDKEGHLDEKKLKLELYKKHARCSSNYIIKDKNKKSKSTLNQINMIIETERNNLLINKMSKKHNKTSILSDYNTVFDENEVYNQMKNKIPEIETLTITESQNITKRNSMDFSPNKKRIENLYIDKENNKNLLNFISNIENLKTPIKIDYIPNPIIENKVNENNNKDNNDCNINLNQNKNIKNKNDELFDLKLNELEFEIKKSKEERLKIEKLKIEYEQLQLELKKDIEDFSKKKDEFEKFREIELKKIEHDKKSYNLIQEKNNLLILSSKKDKETIEQLKRKITKLQEENKIKEIENKRLKDQIKLKIKEPFLKKNITVNTFDTENISPNLQKNQIKKINNNKKNMTKSITSKRLSNPKIRKTISMDSDFTNSAKEIGKNINNTLIKIPKKENKINNKTKIKYKNIKNNINNNNININNSNYKNENKIEENEKINHEYLINKIKNTPNEDDENYNFSFPEKYHSTINENKIIKSASNEGKTINIYSNNKKEVIFQSGVRKEIFDDGYQIVYFINGDIKQIFPNEKIVYFFNEAKTVQITYKSGLQVFKFNNGQIEKHFLDGSKQINFIDGTIRYILNDGYEETYYYDGTIEKIDTGKIITIIHEDGSKDIKFPNGKEEHYNSNGDLDNCNSDFDDINNLEK